MTKGPIERARITILSQTNEGKTSIGVAWNFTPQASLFSFMIWVKEISATEREMHWKKL